MNNVEVGCGALPPNPPTQKKQTQLFVPSLGTLFEASVGIVVICKVSNYMATKHFLLIISNLLLFY